MKVLAKAKLPVILSYISLTKTCKISHEQRSSTDAVSVEIYCISQ